MFSMKCQNKYTNTPPNWFLKSYFSSILLDSVIHTHIYTHFFLFDQIHASIELWKQELCVCLCKIVSIKIKKLDKFPRSFTSVYFLCNQMFQNKVLLLCLHKLIIKFCHWGCVWLPRTLKVFYLREKKKNQNFYYSNKSFIFMPQ